MVYPEFGPGAVTVGSMLLTHPARLVSYNDLGIDIPGDEFDYGADGSFDYAPFLYFYDGEVRFGAGGVARASGYYGSASVSVPQ